jgi:hypothetical protein
MVSPGETKSDGESQHSSNKGRAASSSGQIGL